VEENAAHVRLETTRELLETSFALGDGAETTWGEATVDQHQQRIDLLVKGASGTIETASRHAAAINMIQAAGVGHLNEVPS
jgi:hypothetical protein